MEVIARGGGNLSVALIGHPKLRNGLRRPTMEEIGHRTDVLSFEGLGEETRAYLDWLLGECTSDGVDVDTLIEPAALDLMALRLSTPLQFAEHLNRAFEAGLRFGHKSITTDIVAATLAPRFRRSRATADPSGVLGSTKIRGVKRRWQARSGTGFTGSLTGKFTLTHLPAQICTSHFLVLRAWPRIARSVCSSARRADCSAEWVDLPLLE